MPCSALIDFVLVFQEAQFLWIFSMSVFLKLIFSKHRNSFRAALAGVWLASPAFADEAQIKVAQPGQNITLWDGWNVDATIFIKLDGGTGNDCIKLWWITMGINSDSWEICNQAEIEVSLPLIYGELRAGHFSRKTAVSVSDNADVAYQAELCGRVIEC